MKEIQAPRLSSIDEVKQLPATSIECLNWPEYGHAVPTTVQIGWTPQHVCVRFVVAESDPRTETHEDFGPVWQDSCVEFFCQPPGSDKYFNFEYNSAGYSTTSRRRGRKDDVQPLSAEAMRTIERYPERAADHWSLTVAIPLALIFGDEAAPGQPRQLRGNFYKCGDKTAQPHFQSWCPIDTPAPDFHRPEFFGKITLVD